MSSDFNELLMTLSLAIFIHVKKKILSFTLDKGACACANFGKTHTHKRTRAWAIRILAKRTRACDVRAVENRVCECACVRGKNSSQLTVWICAMYLKTFCYKNNQKCQSTL